MLRIRETRAKSFTELLRVPWYLEGNSRKQIRGFSKLRAFLGNMAMFVVAAKTYPLEQLVNIQELISTAKRLLWQRTPLAKFSTLTLQKVMLPRLADIPVPE